MPINLRRVSEAIIADGSITTAKLADSAVTSLKVADGAVDLSTAKVTGSLPNTKLDTIVDVTKINDNLITLAKVDNDVKVTPFVGGEIEQSTTGTAENAIVETGMIKVTGKYVPRLLRVILTLKTNDVLKTANAKIYIDEEVAARITLTSVALAYELLNAEADISDLATGRHKITMKIFNSAVDGITSNDYVDFYLVK